MKITIENIIWDNDDEDGVKNLPQELILEISKEELLDYIEDLVTEKITEQYCFTLESYEFDIEEEKDNINEN